jgi:putative ABC transport system permease protein
MLFGIEGELALKNLKRNRRRYRATLFSLFISIVLYISFSSFMTYGLESNSIYSGEEMEHDLEVVKEESAGLDEVNHFYNQVVQLDEVERFSIVRSIYSTAPEMKWEQLGSFIQKAVEEKEELRDFLRTPEGKYRFNFNLITVGEAEFAHYVQKLNHAIFSSMVFLFMNVFRNRNRIEFTLL